MIITIDINPELINSPKEIGELVVKQMIREAEGKPRVDLEESRHFVRSLMNVANDKNKFLELLSGKPFWK